MTPEREAEIRALARGMLTGHRHRRIGYVLAELLETLDRERGRTDNLYVQTSEDTAHVLASLTQAHRQELGELRALVILYREHMEAHGLTPPDDSGAEALKRFRHVFEKAGHLDEFQHVELLADWWGGRPLLAGPS